MIIGCPQQDVEALPTYRFLDQAKPVNNLSTTMTAIMASGVLSGEAPAPVLGNVEQPLDALSATLRKRLTTPRFGKKSRILA